MFNIEEEEIKVDDLVDKIWVFKRSLKSYLDIVRVIVFVYGFGIMLVIGGDDCMVKVWLVDLVSIIFYRYVLFVFEIC